MPSIPPEVEQHILLQHLESRTALRSCSLVCSRFGYWAQSRLFESIVVSFRQRGDFPNPWIGRMRRLAGVLEASPHLALFVRRVKVWETTADVLAIIATMSLPNLHTLKLRGILRSDGSDVIQSFRRIVWGSSLRNLQLDFEPSSGNASYFSAFAAVLPFSLVSLNISRCMETSVDPWDAAVLPCARLRPYSPTIQRLRLHFCPEAIALLNSPACPIDLGSVKHLDYCHSAYPELSLLLRRLGRTVDSITFRPAGPGGMIPLCPLLARIHPLSDTSLSNFDFHMLPGLVHIDCWLTEELILDVIERLPVANRIRSLRVGTSHPRWQDPSVAPDLDDQDMEQLGSDFEDAVLRRLPDLTTIMLEVTIIPDVGEPNHPVFDATSVAAAIRKSMPRLSSKPIFSLGLVHDKYFRAQQRI
ncbi:hypothetical protein GGX14DRAFT_565823 [Mycena pura]|uniref:Uncharacterized protein n=1 Tax=Mycena pura TaxID=153505 RepID=A0AAD6VEU5_9AGAR|nr:hypothetical protein GGX14DRAFT_565823 [Mycena pura]